ncbi:MAG: glycoside hydrolase family 1 protein [Clostridiales bacterium]|nr:glycoside hydrolase family 1 protein [Clostridiales bacterium]
MIFTLENMSLGVAAAATQIEGGDLGHSWNDWYRRGRIKDGSDPARATDHWNRWKGDAGLMAGMGLRHYRLGIEWARICPTRDMADQAAVARYREELQHLRELGISPLLTIHHFTNPMWFEDMGGFTKAENIEIFLDFVALAVRSFGDLVSEYITINEPNVYATESYYFGEWPPGEKSMGRAMTVMANMAVCHIRAYGLIHHIRREMGFDDTRVSFAHHMRAFDPKSPMNPFHRTGTRLMERLFQGVVTPALCRGIFKWPLRAPATTKRGEYVDFIAVNYYTRTIVSGFSAGTRKGAPLNDLGWEIYPEGMLRCLRAHYGVIQRPIYITENGTCDNTDAFRCRYIYEHLKALCGSGLPVERYYHWCFCDNFEWAEGESARFGLVHVDYETQKRTVKKSGEFYRDVLRAGGVTEELYEAYVKGQEYHD